MSKTILLVAGQSKDELDLAAILKEINYGVFVESDSSKVLAYLQTHAVHLVIAFERVLLLESASYERWLEFLKKKSIPVLWAVSPAFMREHSHIQESLWPFDLDTAIDLIETTIGLPSPPEEHTQKISEAEVNERVVLSQQATLEKKLELAQEEVKKLKIDLKNEKDLVQKAKQLLQQTLEILK